MSLISFSNVTKYYSVNMILDHVSFSINKGEKIALIGDNGAGKTTLFKLILKEELPTLVAKEDKPGDISILNGTSIGYLSQDAISNVNNTVREELMLAFTKILAKLDYFHKISAKLEYDGREKTIEEYDNLLVELNELGAFNIENRIEEFLTRFNFPKSILDNKIKFLSGGERMKVAFIKLLLGNYDVLLLDEPTNHIDISTIEWLEEYLKTYKGTILFISHDRYFLSALADKILDLESHKVTTYKLRYDDYLNAKNLIFKQRMAQYEKEEEEMARLKRFIEFYMPKPRFVGRAKDRVHKLERLEERHIDKPHQENKQIKFKIEGQNLKNKALLECSDVVVGYDFALLPKVSFRVYGQDRIAIVGDNGIGKTTFIKTILKEIEPINGSVNYLRDLKIGYIKQNDYDFKSNLTCVDYLASKYPAKTEREIRTALGRFLFKKEDAFKNCSFLSNGEKMRLVLCDLSLSSYDLLFLDEPTNHLDLVTKECLLDALKTYKGAIIFVSHDRYFVNSLADSVLYLSKDLILFNEGNYDDVKLILDAKKEQNLEKNLSFTGILENSVKKPEKKGLSNNKIKELENEKNEIEKRINNIDLELSKDIIDYTKIDNLNSEKDNLEYRYLEILEILENC